MPKKGKKKAAAPRQPAGLRLVALRAEAEYSHRGSAEVARRQASLLFEAGVAEAEIEEAKAALAQARARLAGIEAQLAGLGAVAASRARAGEGGLA